MKRIGLLTALVRIGYYGNQNLWNATKKLVWVSFLFLLAPRFASAQVYSQNIVGYVNVLMPNGYRFVANPLDDDNGNALTNILQGPTDGSQVYVWDVTNQIFLPPAIYHTAQAKWSTNYSLPVGMGFVVYNPAQSSWTNTFVGNVLGSDGQLQTNFLAGSNKLSLVGSLLPFAGTLFSDTNLNFPRLNGAEVHFFNRTNQIYSDACIYFAGRGWYNSRGVASADGPPLDVADSFFIRNSGSDANWLECLDCAVPSPNMATKTSASVLASATTAVTSATPTKPSKLRLHNGKVELTPLAHDNLAYNVQFSTDGYNWTTLAVKQNSAVWTGAFSGASRGFYRLVNSN